MTNKNIKHFGKKMNFQNFPKSNKPIFIAQVISVSLIWVFVISISVWILNLISISLKLNDVPGATVGISIIAIPVFISLASVLTYVFIGLQKVEE